MSDFPDWIDSPAITAVVCHGTGKSVVTGLVRIVFSGANTVYVRTDAHHNDDKPALTYRGRDWLADAHLTRNADDGTWAPTDERGSWGVSVRERGVIGKDAPQTFRDAIRDALCAVVAQHWTPDRADMAVYASAIQQLGGARRDWEAAKVAYAEAADKLTRLENLARAYTPPRDATRQVAR